MTLRPKLLWACSPLLLAMALVAGVATVACLRLGSMPGTILSANFRTIDAVYQMREALDRLDREVEAEAEAPHVDERSVRRFEDALDLQVHNITEPGEQPVTDSLASAWRQYHRVLARTAGASASREHALAAPRDAIQTALGEILRINHAAMLRRTDAAAEEGNEAVGTTLTLSVVALVVALGVSAVLLRRLLLPLKVVDRGVRRIAEGDFDARLKVRGEDEVATLARSFNEMSDKLAAYRNSSLGEVVRARSQLEAVMDSLPDALVLYDLHGAPLLANRAAASLIPRGWSGRAADLPAPLERAVLDALSAVRADRAPHVPASVDAAVELPGGERGRWWLIAAHPVGGLGGKLDGISVALRDVSRARRAADFRGDLVAAAAHELRTPLTSLHMAIHLCLEQVPGPLNDRQLDLLDAARQDCERLEGLVEELLDLARLEAGAVRLEVEDRRASELVSEAAGRIADRAQQADVMLREALPETSPEVRVDADRVHRVFDNLLENAIRHGGDGNEIEIGLDEEAEEVRFWVRDHGPGIPEELREHVFEKFVRVPGTPKRGSGLGLSIVRDVVHAHGGRCGVEPAPGGGSRFWFTLPKASTRSQLV